MGGCPPIWCAFTPGFIVWMMVLIDCTLKLIYFMLISVHSDRFHSPLQFFVSMKTAAFFSIALQFDRPELSNWPIGGLEIQFDKFGKIWCGRMKACDLLGWIHYKATGGSLFISSTPNGRSNLSNWVEILVLPLIPAKGAQKNLWKREIYCDFKAWKLKKKNLQGEKAVYFLKDFFYFFS